MLHTRQHAEELLALLRANGFSDARLIGSFGNGLDSSEHDIDILIPGTLPNTLERNELKTKLLQILKTVSKTVSSVCETDWDGIYCTDTRFGNVDIFFDTSRMLQIVEMKPEYVPYVKKVMIDRWEVTEKQTEPDIQRWLNGTDGAYCLVGIVDGNLIATAAFDPYSDVDDTLTPWNTLLWVEPQFRGEGYGQKLTAIRLDRAKKMGYTTVYLDTENAKEYHAKFGWKTVKELVYRNETVTIMSMEL